MGLFTTPLTPPSIKNLAKARLGAPLHYTYNHHINFPPIVVHNMYKKEARRFSINYDSNVTTDITELLYYVVTNWAHYVRLNIWLNNRSLR